jgi:predicted hydrocarbon binding protein
MTAVAAAPKSAIGDDVRPVLGEFMSLVCFKAALRGVEDTLGDDGASVVLVRAGKMRGHDVARIKGLVGSSAPLEELAAILDGVFGEAGTRLCRIQKIYQAGDDIVVEAQEAVCTANEPKGSGRKCTYSLGAVGGALEAITGKTLRAEHTESVLRGGTCEKFVFSPL